ncbi:hypothetical protein [uncultured Tateyamaria sp.]|uniref:hypothetical protein n=1 Tax=uncultured Tateyamaria sp. TaxID=455651 RepID=UPI0026174E29|nr:hypothetical protein [uncultured Tateyamaria sp.]
MSQDTITRSQKPGQTIITTKATSGDVDQSLEVVWEALAQVREELLPEGEPIYDAQWDEITTAMGWITEALGIDPMDTEVSDRGTSC